MLKILRKICKPRTWENWSGSVRFAPRAILRPRDEADIQAVVRDALEKGHVVRAVGSGHSSTPLVETTDMLLDMSALTGLLRVDRAAGTATLRAGTTIAQAGRALAAQGMRLHNMGDIDHQHLAGAFATGTHGSGARLSNLPSVLAGCRLVDGKGDLRSFDEETAPEMMRAARLSLGALGIFTEVTIRVRPEDDFVRREYCADWDTLLERRDELIAGNEMFDFYWYPRTNAVKLRTCNPRTADGGTLDFAREQRDRRREGPLHKVLPKDRSMKFDEMEYAIPADAGPACFDAVRRRVLDKHAHYVWWRLLYRTVAADDAYLSPFSGRDCVTIAVLQNIEQPYDAYFRDIEPILREFGGRPHWGKKHFIDMQELRGLYPEWDAFERHRKTCDPDGVFLNAYLRRLFA